MNTHSYTQYRQKRQHGTAEFPVAYFYSPDLLPEDTIPLHWHPEYELMHVAEGTMELSINGQLYLVPEDTYYLVYSECLHGADISHCIYETIVFSADRLFAQWPFCPAERRLLSDHKLQFCPELSSNNRLHGICQELFQTLRGSSPSFRGHSESDPIQTGTDRSKEFDVVVVQDGALPTGYQFHVIGLLYQLIGALFAEHHFTDSREAVLSQNVFQKIKNTLLYIEEHYSEQISLDQLARAAGLNAKYLCRLFKTATLSTPVEYLNRYRIDQACRLLSTTDNSITEIALQCGFNETSYFIRLFRRYKGISPSKYGRSKSV